VIEVPRNSDVDADGGSMAAGMSALKRIPDSGQTSRHVRFVPMPDMPQQEETSNQGLRVNSTTRVYWKYVFYLR
jgi:hypothetical protein